MTPVSLNLQLREDKTPQNQKEIMRETSGSTSEEGSLLTDLR